MRIEFLTGQYCAQAHDDRNWPEWPPHPARVFSALVAAWAEAGMDAEEKAALEWLEALPAPEISASHASVRGIDPALRKDRKDRAVTVTNYVPVNDPFVISPKRLPKQYEQLAAARARVDLADGEKARAKAQKSLDSQRKRVRSWSANEASPAMRAPSASIIADKLSLLPDTRAKQPRTFPIAIPDDPVVFLTWKVDTSEAPIEVIDKLMSRVGRLGHSSSLVSLSVVEESPPATLVPSREGVHIRVTGPGQLGALVRAHGVHGGVAPRQLPFRPQMYSPPDESKDSIPVSRMSGEWLLLEVKRGARLGMANAMALTQTIRAALMSHAAEPIPLILSGHEPDGAPARREHLAILPLPFVGREHADGDIRGFALMLPRGASTQDAAAVAQAVQTWSRASGGNLRLNLPGQRDVHLSVVVDGVVPWTLQRYRWSRLSHYWVSVSPLAFDRAPGRLWSAKTSEREAAQTSAEQVVALACERVGLPTPLKSDFMQTSGLVGVPSLHDFPAYASPGRRTRRVSAHVVVTFAQPIRGPLVLGAGRFFGMGLFAPVGEGSHLDATRY
jgi:CRISPR-associated protein Csb2